MGRCEIFCRYFFFPAKGIINLMFGSLKITMHKRVGFFCFLLFAALTGAVRGQNFTQKGVASFYADKFVGRLTASGEKYHHNKLTAAHKTLPFGTTVRVKNLDNGKEVTVRINDRGPFVEGRIIDLSKSAAKKLDFITKGLAAVELTVINSPEPDKTPYSTLDKPVEVPEDLPAEYYALSVHKKKPQGYGVQVGSFREMVNLVQLADELQNSYKGRIFIQVSVIQDVKYYKIIIGKLKSEEKAAKLKEKARKKYPGSFVVKF